MEAEDSDEALRHALGNVVKAHCAMGRLGGGWGGEDLGGG